MSLRSHPAISRRRLLAGVGAGLSTLAVWGVSPLVTAGSLPEERPAIVGHRGAEGLAPPNTMAAIRRALETGVDGIELDVRRTDDGRLVLFHDPVLDWDSDGQGWIRNQEWAAIRGTRIDGEPLITLPTALEVLTDTDVSIYLELKEPGYTEAVLEAVADYGVLDRLTVLGFDPEPLEPAAEAGVRTGLVGSTPTSQLADDAADCDADAVFCHYAPRLTSGFLEEVRDDGRTAGIWKLVETRESTRDALEAGPDVLITNRPDHAFDILDGGEPTA